MMLLETRIVSIHLNSLTINAVCWIIQQSYFKSFNLETSKGELHN